MDDLLCHLDDYDDDIDDDDIDDDDDYDDDDQYNDPVDDGGASLSDGPPENEINNDDESQGKSKCMCRQ